MTTRKVADVRACVFVCVCECVAALRHFPNMLIRKKNHKQPRALQVRLTGVPGTGFEPSVLQEASHRKV